MTIVTASFANAVSEDWNVPHTPTDVINWLSVGYTSAKRYGRRIINAAVGSLSESIRRSGQLRGDGTAVDPTATYVATDAIRHC